METATLQEAEATFPLVVCSAEHPAQELLWQSGGSRLDGLLKVRTISVSSVNDGKQRIQPDHLLLVVAIICQTVLQDCRHVVISHGCVAVPILQPTGGRQQADTAHIQPESIIGLFRTVQHHAKSL